MTTQPPKFGETRLPGAGRSEVRNKLFAGPSIDSLPQSERSGRSDPAASDCPSVQTKLLSGNSILGHLPREEFNHLKPYLRPIPLRRGQIVRDVADHIDSLHLPLSGMICLFAVMANGSTVVLAATGREGFLGVAALLADGTARLRAVVLVEGDAVALDCNHLQRILPTAPQFAAALRRYCSTHLSQVLQIGACHALHTVQQRVSLWLLLVRDRNGSDSLPLTHESLSELLGCRRASVTEALSALENADLIRGSRGQISIRDRMKLSEQACECYAVLRDRATFV